MMLQMSAVIWSAAWSLALAAHLVCVNIAAVGPLACIWLEARARRTGQESASVLGKWLAHLCCKLLLVGMALGVALGWLAWQRGDDGLFSALERVPFGRLKWGVAELVFYYACMLPYAAFWSRLRKRYWIHRLLAIFAATNLIYHFPPLFVVIKNLSGATADTAPLSSREFLHMTMQPDVLSRVTHHWVAAVAVVGAAVMLRARRMTPDTHDTASGERSESIVYIRAGAWAALIATLLQIPVGLWVLLQSPAAWRDQLLGSAWWPTSLFVASMAAGLATLHALAAVALGEVQRKQTRTAVLLLLLTVLLMTATASQLG
jgi:hypothetical protein